MAPDCNQLWIADGGGEGGSVVGRRMSPNLVAGSKLPGTARPVYALRYSE